MTRRLRARMHSPHSPHALEAGAGGGGGACTELGLGVDAAAPQIDQRLGDGEAEPGAAVRALHRAVRLLEGLEQLRQHVAPSLHSTHQTTRVHASDTLH